MAHADTFHINVIKCNYIYYYQLLDNACYSSNSKHLNKKSKTSSKGERQKNDEGKIKQNSINL